MATFSKKNKGLIYVYECLYFNPVQNESSLSKINNWLTLIGCHSGQKCLGNIQVAPHYLNFMKNIKFIGSFGISAYKLMFKRVVLCSDVS